MKDNVQRKATTPTPPKAAGLSTMDLIGGNFGGGAAVATDNVTPLSTRRGPSSQQAIQNARVLANSVEAATSGLSPEQMEAVREKILSAEINKLQQQVPDDQRSLAALVEALDLSWEEVGAEFENVEKFNDREQGEIDSAKSAVANAESLVSMKQAAVTKAGAKTYWFGGKEKAIAKANQELADARLALENMSSLIADAEKRARNMRSTRLQGADFTASFARIIARFELTRNILLDRLQMFDKQYVEVTTAKDRFLKEKTEAAKKMEELKSELDAVAAQLAIAQENVAGLEPGSEARSRAEEKVSALFKEHEDIRVMHDQVLVIFQEKSQAAEKQALDEASMRANIHAHKTYLAKLIAGRESWEIEFNTRVAQIKGLADQAATDKLIKVGDATRIENAQFSAQSALASIEGITRMAEQHPDQMAQLGNIVSALKDGFSKIDQRWKTIDANLRENGVTGSDKGAD